MKQQGIYFGACDRQMETFLDERRFVDALVYGILFQGNLVVSDVYFYNSSYVRNALLGDGSKTLLANFFLKGVCRGVIVPSFRRTTDETFYDNLEGIESAGVQGMYPEHRQIAAKLDNATRGVALHPHYWPTEAVSKGFKQTLARVLSPATVGAESPEFSRIWEETRNLRLSFAENLPLDQVGGVRRGDLYNLALQQVKGVTATVTDMTEIWSGLAPRRAATLERILKWVNYCYYYNQSRMFGLKPSLSALDEYDIPFARNLALLEDGHKVSNVLYFEIPIPSTDSLLTIKPDLLLDVRQSDVAQDYFDALHSWQSNPTAEAAGTLEETLRVYADRILGVYQQHGAHLANWKEFLRVHLPEGPSMWVGGRHYNVRDSSIEMAAAVVPGLSNLSAVGEVATGIYTFLPAKLRDVLAPIAGANARVRLEVEQQMDLLQVRDRSQPVIKNSETNAVFQ